jgi:hypothetical protein
MGPLFDVFSYVADGLLVKEEEGNRVHRHNWTLEDFIMK